MTAMRQPSMNKAFSLSTSTSRPVGSVPFDMDRRGRSHCAVSSMCPDDNNDKTRQLPCKTFISVGWCPYRDRCIYIHDPRLMHPTAKSKTRKKNKEDKESQDSFYWPTIPRTTHGKGSVYSRYTVPAATTPTGCYSDSEAMYSLWNHFVDFCTVAAASVRTDNTTVNRKNKSRETHLSDSTTSYDDPFNTRNKHSSGSRLAVFVNLSTVHDRLLEESELSSIAIRRLSRSSASTTSSSASSFLDEFSTPPTSNPHTMASSPVSYGLDDWETADGFVLQSADRECTVDADYPRVFRIPGDHSVRSPPRRVSRTLADSPTSTAMAMERWDLSPHNAMMMTRVGSTLEKAHPRVTVAPQCHRPYESIY
eukprot:CAMPEP_0185039334 /NCGR_PEP_ID=MMETSP1103-20130426/36100_1 /TAXON_ID=36769 /ORGANISM="Paraphysomonas bandaiensis, Strain Caron Lab Isolate" /LENGTH=364 /DNA_ID=CAMNT_0027578185 /DNA_START=125 /DNA_END=1219 /DNA_ORIENTATION=+